MRRRDRPGVVADVVDVDLVDEGDAGPTSAAPDDDPGRGRTARRLAVAVLLVLAVGVVSVNIAEARATAARREALAGTPRVLASLGSPLSEAWRTDGVSLLAEGESVLVLTDDDRALTGVRAEDGVPLWTRETAPSGDEYCTPLDIWLLPLSSVPTWLTQDHLLCLRSAALFGPAPQSGTTTELSTIAVATGAEVEAIALPGGLIGWLPVPDGVVVATFGTGGRVRITSWDPVTGAVNWSHASEGVFADASAIRWEITEATIGYAQDDTFVTLSFETGAAADRADVERLAEVFALPDGATVTWRIDLDTSAETIAVVEADGTERFQLDGSLRWPVVRDPASRLLLVQPAGSADLAALDISTGETVWTVETMASSAAQVELSGIVVVSGATTAVALDAEDGTMVWSAAVAPGATGVTDGFVVLLLEPGGDGLSLVAHDLEHGEERWRVEVPSGTRSVRSAAGVTVLETASGVVALR
jgi:outer membrane protein assembly factor BamB